MDIKTIGVMFLASVLALVCVGCTTTPQTPSTVASETKNSADIYASAQEAALPGALASEVKSILAKSCGEIKFTQALLDPLSKSTIWVYIWKNEPTEEKLLDAFQAAGYTIDVPGEPFFATKGKSTLIVSWSAELESQEIAVMLTQKIE